jgi:hypothetical protein
LVIKALQRGRTLGHFRFGFGNIAGASFSPGSFAPNNSFKPTPHRGSARMLTLRQHAVAAPLRGGLTQALGA